MKTMLLKLRITEPGEEPDFLDYLINMMPHGVLLIAGGVFLILA